VRGGGEGMRCVCVCGVCVCVCVWCVFVCAVGVGVVVCMSVSLCLGTMRSMCRKRPIMCQKRPSVRQSYHPYVLGLCDRVSRHIYIHILFLNIFCFLGGL